MYPPSAQKLFPAHSTLVLLAYTLLCTGIATLGFGPLSPPAGPVASSYKTLSEIEPRTFISPTTTPGTDTATYRITSPGSYYLKGNLVGDLGRNCIEIAANDVTLDLNGFTITGVANASAGITLGANVSSIIVRNGCVRDFGGNGVDLLFARGCLIEDIHAAHNALSQAGSAGIKCGYGSIVSRCTVTQNTGYGIVAQSSTVTDCTATGNSNDGIVGDYCTISKCTAVGNSGNGFSSNYDSIITNCMANTNTGCGISVNSGCLVLNNLCTSNGTSTAGTGAIRATLASNRLEGNLCINSRRGILCNNFGNTILRNTCRGNTVGWEIGANNIVGEIVDRRTPGSAAINGFSAPASTGTTDPNANFTY